MDKREVILTAKDLSKTFSNESVQQHVLKNLNLNIYKGDFTVVMGNSGSGKSTLLYALSGMDRPSLGNITYFVDDISSLKTKTADKSGGIEISKFSNDKLALFRRDHAGFVFQQNYLNDSMSALDNVLVAGNTKDKDMVDKAKKTLTDLGLKEREFRKKPAKLSGGQCQRVAIARAMSNDPKVIFADEPTASLDHENAFNVMSILKKYSEDRLVLVVTHDRSILSDVDMMIEMWDGSISNTQELA